MLLKLLLMVSRHPLYIYRGYIEDIYIYIYVYIYIYNTINSISKTSKFVEILKPTGR